MPRSLRLIWSPQAEDDLFEVWLHLAREASPETADRQVRNIHDACNRLVDWPLSGRARDEIARGLRSVVVGPYVVFHRVSDLAIEVARVLHGRRDVERLFSDQNAGPTGKD